MAFPSFNQLKNLHEFPLIFINLIIIRGKGGVNGKRRIGKDHNRIIHPIADATSNYYLFEKIKRQSTVNVSYILILLNIENELIQFPFFRFDWMSEYIVLQLIIFDNIWNCFNFSFFFLFPGKYYILNVI